MLPFLCLLFLIFKFCIITIPIIFQLKNEKLIKKLQNQNIINKNVKFGHTHFAMLILLYSKPI